MLPLKSTAAASLAAKLRLQHGRLLWSPALWGCCLYAVLVCFCVPKQHPSAGLIGVCQSSTSVCQSSTFVCQSSSSMQLGMVMRAAHLGSWASGGGDQHSSLQHGLESVLSDVIRQHQIHRLARCNCACRDTRRCLRSGNSVVGDVYYIGRNLQMYSGVRCLVSGCKSAELHKATMKSKGHHKQ